MREILHWLWTAPPTALLVVGLLALFFLWGFGPVVAMLLGDIVRAFRGD